MNKNQKFVLGCAILFAFGGDCFADTKIGIGSGATSVFSSGYGGVISMPIKLDSYLLIEPYLGYTKRSGSADSSLPDYSYSDSKSYQAGVGIYGIRKLSSEFELYYGAALATAKSNRKNESKDTRSNNNETSISFNQYDTEATEYMIKPTLGLSYFVNEFFTVSVDAGIYYSWGEEKTKSLYDYTSPTYSSHDTSESTTDLEGVSTFTRLIFRMMF